MTLYLTRIALYEDRLNGLIAVNPTVLRQAEERDRERAHGRVRGPLHGIPIALKDNIHALISKVSHADALKCPSCGGQLQTVAYITDELAIRDILERLGLGPPQEPRPPPEARYLPIDDEGRELPEMVAE